MKEKEENSLVFVLLLDSGRTYVLSVDIVFRDCCTIAQVCGSCWYKTSVVAGFCRCVLSVYHSIILSTLTFPTSARIVCQLFVLIEDYISFSPPTRDSIDLQNQHTYKPKNGLHIPQPCLFLASNTFFPQYPVLHPPPHQLPRLRHQTHLKDAHPLPTPHDPQCHVPQPHLRCAHVPVLHCF